MPRAGQARISAGRADSQSGKLGYHDDMRGVAQGAPDVASPQFFTFMRDSVGAGEIKGVRERWIAPAALYSGSAGIGESSWTVTPETVIALRLHGAAVEDHNRRVTRTST